MNIHQVMAECDCQHYGCIMRKYCMAERITQLERDYAEACNESADCYIKQCRAEARRDKVTELVEQAFHEGFADGYDGGYVEGDSYPAWKRSFVLDELEKQ